MALKVALNWHIRSRVCADSLTWMRDIALKPNLRLGIVLDYLNVSLATAFSRADICIAFNRMWREKLYESA